MEHRTIEIDFDVHKIIEANRRSFDETPNDVLRRLLGIEEEELKPGRNANFFTRTGLAWCGKGVHLPNDTQVRMSYNGVTSMGQIKNGQWVINGREYLNPSPAAHAAARTRDGKRPSLNGWVYWEVKRPKDEDWVKLSSLRDKVQ